MINFIAKQIINYEKSFFINFIHRIYLICICTSAYAGSVADSNWSARLPEGWMARFAPQITRVSELLELIEKGETLTTDAVRRTLGMIEQGSLESSNVNVVEELVNMIETQRAYEMNSKAIATTDQMLEYVTNQL